MFSETGFTNLLLYIKTKKTIENTSINKIVCTIMYLSYSVQINYIIKK